MKEKVEFKKFYLKTFGCQMNVRDSEVICGLLLRTNNYELTTNPDEADIVIFNTCSVRQHAEDKVWSQIGRFKNGRAIIGIAGCMAQSYKEKVFERAPRVDFVVSPQDLHKIPQIIKELSTERRGASPSGDTPLLLRKIWETDGSVRPEEIYHAGFYEDKGHAYVVISEGCSNFCSYCVVPYVRGPLRHRRHQDILREIEGAAAQGITSITLLGQNVNAYADGTIGLVELIALAERVKGPKEFTFITSHPRDTNLTLFKAMADSQKLKKYLHLPVQSGSDRILGLMNRGYAKDFYLDLVNNYRKIVKGGILTTDIIVGFPTETEDDFRDTYNLAEDIGFNAAFIFKYSVRPHTVAQGLADDVPQQEKERRHALILQLQKKISKQNPLPIKCHTGN